SLPIGGVLASRLPDHIGTLLLGDVWPQAQPLIVPVAIGAAGTALSSGAGNGLRVMAAARWSLRARVFAAPLTVIAVVCGAEVASAAGAAWALAASQMIVSCVWWWYFSKAIRSTSMTVAPEWRDDTPRNRSPV